MYSICAAYVQCMCSVCAVYVQRMCSVCAAYVTYLLGIRNSALIGCMSLRGGSPSAISSNVIPSDHMSERVSYEALGSWSHTMTSGAILQEGSG